MRNRLVRRRPHRELHGRPVEDCGRFGQDGRAGRFILGVDDARAAPGVALDAHFHSLGDAQQLGDGLGRGGYAGLFFPPLPGDGDLESAAHAACRFGRSREG